MQIISKIVKTIKCLFCKRQIDRIGELVNENEKLNKMLAKEVKEEDLEKEINSKYPKARIMYRGRPIPGSKSMYNMDVRNFFVKDDFLLQDVVSDNKLNIGTYDERALKALVWIIDNVKYILDDTLGHSEFWQYHSETISRGKGDCEDGAILLANLMVTSGIPYYRIRLNAGDVKGGGHAYVSYCRETDNEFVVLDWCYWASKMRIKDRILHKNERNYYSVWFSWNAKYSFAKAIYSTAVKRLFKPNMHLMDKFIIKRRR